jgi:hypothetical protein
MEDKKTPKNAKKFLCELCDFRCSKQSEWDRHLSTRKHKKETNGLQNDDIFAPKNAEPFMCSCGKIYKHRQGLWKHTKICLSVSDNVKKDSEKSTEDSILDNPTKELILLLVKENSELKNMMIEQQNKMFEQQNKMVEQQNIVLEIAKNGIHNITNNTTNTNSHNKAFNLNFFLNETCKDAMNIMDFVDSIKLQLTDLEKVGELGYVEGISNIIVKNLKELDVTQRPVHCTDKKRETIYVKEEDKWEKDNENKKMHKMVRKVQDKNFKMIQKFKEKYPDYNRASSKHSDVYNNIIIESMGGKGDNDYEKEERIIKIVSKEVVVEK